MYSGDTNDAGSTGMLTQTVNQAAVVTTTTTLASSVNPSTLGQPVTFTATVTPASGTTIPTGTVEFFVDGSTAPADTVPVNGSGQASFTTSSLSGGTHSITAQYISSDTSLFSGSTSAALSQNVLTASQQANELIQEVGALVPVPLNAGQGNALMVKLALKGNNGDIGKVNAFIAQVNSFLSAGILTTDQANPLIQGADNLLVTLKLG